MGEERGQVLLRNAVLGAFHQLEKTEVVLNGIADEDIRVQPTLEVLGGVGRQGRDIPFFVDVIFEHQHKNLTEKESPLRYHCGSAPSSRIV